MKSEVKFLVEDALWLRVRCLGSSTVNCEFRDAVWTLACANRTDDASDIYPSGDRNMKEQIVWVQNSSWSKKWQLGGTDDVTMKCTARVWDGSNSMSTRWLQTVRIIIGRTLGCHSRALRIWSAHTHPQEMSCYFKLATWACMLCSNTSSMYMWVQQGVVKQSARPASAVLLSVRCTVRSRPIHRFYQQRRYFWLSCAAYLRSQVHALFYSLGGISSTGHWKIGPIIQKLFYLWVRSCRTLGTRLSLQRVFSTPFNDLYRNR